MENGNGNSQLDANGKLSYVNLSQSNTAKNTEIEEENKEQNQNSVAGSNDELFKHLSYLS